MTGISVGDYRDPERGLDLGELLLEAAQVPGIARVRLSSVEVIHVKDSLVAALREEPKVCPHLHVPLQSGDDAVLAAMGRHYTAAEYLDTIRALRAAVPRVNLTTDVIVVSTRIAWRSRERWRWSRLPESVASTHSRTRSRPGTAAEALGDRVPPEEKKRRSQVMRGLSRSAHATIARLSSRRPCACSSTRWPRPSARVQRRLHPLLPTRGGGDGRRAARRERRRALRRWSSSEHLARGQSSLGVLFLKYISEAFERRHQAVRTTRPYCR